MDPAEQARIAAQEQQLALRSDAAQQQGSRAAGQPRRSSVSDAARASATDDECRALAQEKKALTKALQQLRIDHEKSEQQARALTGRLDKETAVVRELQAAAKATDAQMVLMKKELAVGQRGATKGRDDTDVRLRRALEDLERCRTKLAEKESAEARAASSDANEATAIGNLQAENKMLLAQRTEFLNCLRKQNKLIDVLKRQKLHLEAAKLLQLTEQEFTAALECHEDA
jgi:hypothetical protein